MHATDGTVILVRGWKPVYFHICGINHYANNSPGKDKSDASSNNQDHPTTLPKIQEKSLVNMKVG